MLCALCTLRRSAAVMALSRLLYEFAGTLEPMVSYCMGFRAAALTRG